MDSMQVVLIQGLSISGKEQKHFHVHSLCLPYGCLFTASAVKLDPFIKNAAEIIGSVSNLRNVKAMPTRTVISMCAHFICSDIAVLN